MSFHGLHLAAGVYSPRCRIIAVENHPVWNHKFRFHCRLNYKPPLQPLGKTFLSKAVRATRVLQMSDSNAASLLHSAPPHLGAQPACLQPQFLLVTRKGLGSIALG